MSFESLVKLSRSYRRFDETKRISAHELKELAALTRYCPSTANSQALRFMIFSTKEECEKIFPALHWAAYLKEWEGPKIGHRPTGYIVILCDQTVAKSKPTDDGIVAQTMMLGAVEKGYGGCILGAVDRERLYHELAIDSERYTIDLILAFGVPDEKVVITEIKDGDIRYYRGEDGTHYVPKRKTEELILN